MTGGIPNFPLDPTLPIGGLFLQRGCGDFRSAVALVRSIPYGRTSSRSDFRRVLDEGRGTCSTKHALLRGLAREHEQPVLLYLGIYEMSEANTPGVGQILERYGLTSVPEAHCYLRWHGAPIDATGIEGGDPLRSLLHEEEIEPEDVGEYKPAVHRRFLESWATASNLDATRAWGAREACIRMLEGRSTPFG